MVRSILIKNGPNQKLFLYLYNALTHAPRTCVGVMKGVIHPKKEGILGLAYLAQNYILLAINVDLYIICTNAVAEQASKGASYNLVTVMLSCCRRSIS